MTKAPENIIIGHQWEHYNNTALSFEKDAVLYLQFGTGDRNRSLKYKVKGVKKGSKGIHYIHLVRDYSFS